MFLIDANVIIDVIADDGEWRDWSQTALARAAQSGELQINPIIYAEVAASFPNVAAVDAAISHLNICPKDLPYEAAFLASKAFQQYRRSGGVRTTALPDFFIGAHAKVEGLTLITRDAARFRTYFPGVPLIAPD